MQNLEVDELPAYEESTENNPSTESNWKQFLSELFQTIIMAVVLYFLIDSVVARVCVKNISMLPTLQPGEFLLVSRVAYRVGDLDRGDIVIFHYPADPQDDYIKRAIGIPGDVVEVKDGYVSINGQRLNEPYINAPPQYSGTWTVPEESIFVLGDNRNQSSDSHNWGFVPFDNILGKALYIYWPIDEIKSLAHPILM